MGDSARRHQHGAADGAVVRHLYLGPHGSFLRRHVGDDGAAGGEGVGQLEQLGLVLVQLRVSK
jgi:hypothetical protein